MPGPLADSVVKCIVRQVTFTFKDIKIIHKTEINLGKRVIMLWIMQKNFSQHKNI